MVFNLKHVLTKLINVYVHNMILINITNKCAYTKIINGVMLSQCIFYSDLEKAGRGPFYVTAVRDVRVFGQVFDVFDWRVQTSASN